MVKLNITSIGKVRQNPHTFEDIKGKLLTENFYYVLRTCNREWTLDMSATNSCGIAESMSSICYNSATFLFVMCSGI